MRDPPSATQARARAFATDLGLIPQSLEIPSAAKASRAGSVDHAGKNGARRIGTKLNGHHSIAIRPGVPEKQPLQTLTRMAEPTRRFLGFTNLFFLLREIGLQREDLHTGPARIGIVQDTRPCRRLESGRATMQPRLKR